MIIDNPCLTCHGSGITTRPRVVKVRLPEGVKEGQQIRLKGKGTPGKNGGPTGDLYVRVKVQMPEQLTAEEKTHVEALRALQSQPVSH